MPEEINLEELKKQYSESFKDLPQTLLNLAFSEETPLQIAAICLENGIEDKEKIQDIASHITAVLLGKLPVGILSKAIRVNSKVDSQTAENISRAANSRIFKPVKDILNSIYKNMPAQEEPAPEKKEVKEIAPTLKKSSAKDIYHEQVR